MNTSTQKLFLVTENNFKANENIMVMKSKDVDHEYFQLNNYSMSAKMILEPTNI